MAEKKKAKDEEDLKSTRDVLLKWNEYYMSKDFGIGIQCEKCKKWRQVFQYQDKNEVPDVWNCSKWKIDERRRGSCRIPSDVNEEDFEETKYAPGSLVWAKMQGFPWWPAMIEDCPDAQHYYMPSVDGEPEYHVNFFGSKPLRHWIKESHIKDFTLPPPPMTPKAKKNKDLQKSIEQANEALKMKEKERLAIFSFAVRYKGHWAKVKELDEVDLPPNCLPKKRKEKSSDKVDLPPDSLKKERNEISTDETDSLMSCPKKKRKKKSSDEVDSPTNYVKKRKVESTDEIVLQPDCLKKKTKEKSADEVDLAPNCLKQRKEKSTDEIDLPADCLKKKRKEISTDKVDLQTNCFKKIKKESTDEIDLPPDCLKKKRKEKSADEVESPLNCSKKKLKEKSSDKVELPPNMFIKKCKERSTAFKSQGIARETDGNRDSHLTSKVRKRWNVQSKSDDDTSSIGESQPTVSHREQIEENNSCKNQFGDLSEAGDNNKQLPSEKSDEQLVDPERPDFISNQDEEHRFSTEKSDKESDKEGSQASDNIVLSSDEDEEKLSPAEKLYLGFVNQKYPSRIYDYYKDLKKRNNSSNEGLNLVTCNEYASTVSESHSIISRESVAGFSGNDDIVNRENAAEFSENNHRNAADCLQNEADVYILDADPSLLRTPSCHTSKNAAEFSKYNITGKHKNITVFSENNHGNAAEYSQSDSDVDILDTDPSLQRTPYPYCYVPKDAAEFSRNNAVTKDAAAFSENNHGNAAEYSQSDPDVYILHTDPSLPRTPYSSCYSPKDATAVSKNNIVIKHENVFPEINHGNAVGCTQNESDVYILDKDSSLLRTPYPSCYNSKTTAKFSKDSTSVSNKNVTTFSETNNGNAAEYSQNDSNVYILDTDPSLLRIPHPSCCTPKNVANFSENNTKNATVFSENNHENAAEYSQNESILDKDPSLLRTPYPSCCTSKNFANFSENNTKNSSVFSENYRGNGAEYSQNDSNVHILNTDPSLLRTPYSSCHVPKSAAEFTRNNSVAIHENAAAFSDNNLGKTAEYSQNDSHVYILDKDTSLMGTPYPPCSTPKTEKFPNHEMSKKKRELIDELNNSNNPKYMPYSLYRRKMKK
ncbi:unnamed protein product [Larinioides sclopetarius]|uniref:Zinc finger CW-type PWWP domain protein 1 n=1 Tax=Larinioides sclopetarius TaxID=280406 RepID=A0AAV2BV74_9ARAC